MKTLSVSTLLTAAVMAIFLPNIAHADKTDCSDPKSPELEAECKRNIKLDGDKKEQEVIDLKRKNARGDCAKLSDDLKKVVGEYTKACGEAIPIFKGLSALIGEPAVPSCAGYINQCANPKAASPDGSEDDDDDSSSGIGARGKQKKRGSEELKELTEQARLCNLPPGSEYKEAKENMKQYKKERAKLEEKQRDAQTDIMEMAQEQKSAINKLDDRAEQTRLQFAAKQREILAQKTNKENQISAAILQIEAEAEEMRVNVDRIKLAQTEADIALAEAIGQIERQCHAEALARTEEHRKSVLEQMKNSTYSPGGQSNLFQGVGSSLKAKLKKLASDYFKDCKGSDMTKELMRASKNRKALAVAKAETEIQSMNSKIDRAKAKIASLQTKERAAVLQEANDNLKALQDEVMAAGKKLDNNRSDIGSEVGLKMMKAQTKLANIGADLDREAAEMAGDQAYITLGKLAKLPTNSKGDEIVKAQSELINLRSAALSAATECCAPAIGSDGKPTGDMRDSGLCDAACGMGKKGEDEWNSPKCDPAKLGNNQKYNGTGAK